MKRKRDTQYVLIFIVLVLIMLITLLTCGILYTNMPSVLLEIGFLSNKAERERLKNMDYQTEIAKSIAEGIIKMIE